MYTHKDLEQEVCAKVAALREEGVETMHPDWIAQAIITDHSDIHGEDADFYLCCSRRDVRAEVRRQLNRMKPAPEPESDNQLTLEGFERLQEYYLVTRDREQLAVRIDLLTDAELEEKALELEAMATGCREHAAELRRYRSIRQAQRQGCAA